MIERRTTDILKDIQRVLEREIERKKRKIKRKDTHTHDKRDIKSNKCRQK